MNKKNYENKNIVSNYIKVTLQNPEVIILVNYREYIAGKRVLDIGCGTGRTTAILKNLSSSYIGLDYSLEMIESCRQRFNNVRFVHGDVKDMSKEFGDREFDFIMFSFNGLDSINHADRLQGLREIYRVLSRDGLFVFSSHNRNHRYAISYPKMKLSMTPCRQIKNIKNFTKSMYNYLRNRNSQQFKDEYAIINDVAHNYAMLTYYIDKLNQVSQLEAIGFETIEIYDTLGNKLDLHNDDKDSAWVYYVARKRD